MQPAELLDFLRHSGRDPSHLIFEDELTGIHNRRFLHGYLEHKVRWKGGTDHPLSLLMLDLDRFKEVNDAHGHAAGDQLLAWVASVLQEVAGETGLPVRFGGDEFVVLLPETDRAGARETAARVLQRLRDRPFRLRETGTPIPVSVSIGVATAPADASTSRELLQAADTALYHAKRSGRDQAATATEVDPHKVFPRTALHRLLVTGIVGREAELRAVSEALLALSRGQNQFLLFEGAAGMGKTTLLAAIGRSLAGHETFALARVAGDQQEAYRPYYLATRILVALLARRADKGAGVIQGLTEEEVLHLSQIVPHVAAGAPPLAEADERARRRRIFAALARFVPRVVDQRPLVLIIDDLQFADEATLLLLRAMLQSENLSLFLCGATLEPRPQARQAEAPAIERLYGAGAPEPGVERLKLGNLNQEHIGDYLRSVFPNLRMPGGFEVELAGITQGNPLFLGEIVRKLVADRKVALVGQEWVIEPLAAGYLPRSLEQIVTEQIGALDAEGQRLLEHASTLGEDVPVSMLTGSAALDENRVLEFVDQAEALGLVRTDFQLDDDVMRFLGKRVLDVSYAGMDEGRRAALHERVGAHQEALYQQRFLSSASLLAHHFKQAANQEKATRYEEVQRAYDRTVFDAEEAARYTVELVEEEEDPEARLAPESAALVPNVIRAFMTAARSIQLYPPESKKAPQALEQLREAVDQILVKNHWLQLSRDRHRLRANGRRLDVSEWSGLAASFRELLDRFELQGLTFQRGVTESELRQLLTTLANTKPGALAPGFWRRMAAERGLSHLRPEQVRYSQIVRMQAGTPQPPQTEEDEPGPEELAEIPKILRALQSAAKIVKLYPLDAEPVTHAVEQLHTTVRHALRRRRSLTLAGVGQALLANGVRVDTTGYEAVAKSVVDLLDAVGLESITFRTDVPKPELAAFVAALRDLPPSGTDRRFWDGFARDQGLSGIALNQRRYAVTAVQGLLGGKPAPDDAATEPGVHAAAAERLAAEPLATLQQALPAFGKELLVTGEHGLVRGLLRRLFEGFQEQDPAGRARTVVACRALFDQVIFGLQHTFAELAAGYLLTALATETAPQVLRELGDLLRAMAGSAVQFADYQLASRILLALTTRRRQLQETGGREAGDLAATTLDGRVDPAVLRLLDADVRSGQPERQEQAAKVLGALGAVGVPLLIEAIKGESDFRVRQLAARLVADAGPVAAEQIKRALVTEVIVEQRARLLDVIDTVTPDLRHELQQCLHDTSPRVRRAAFQLFERLRRDDLIDLILPFARHGHPAVARAAIRALAPLRTSAAVDALSSILRATGDPRLAALCCQALGRSEHPAAIEALAGLLAARRLLFFGRRWRSEVRATAAVALKQIPHPRAAEVLARFAHDGDAVVRRLAAGERLPDLVADQGAR